VHILFVHKDYPAQFGLIARYLAQKMGYECTYLTAIPAPGPGSVDVMVSPWGPASSAPSVRTVDGVRLINIPSAAAPPATAITVARSSKTPLPTASRLTKR